mgnify:CR=1 FL=1
MSQTRQTMTPTATLGQLTEAELRTLTGDVNESDESRADRAAIRLSKTIAKGRADRQAKADRPTPQPAAKTRPEPVAAAPRPRRRPGVCCCGCGAETNPGSSFLPGHDAKAKASLTWAIRERPRTQDQAPDAIAAAWLANHPRDEAAMREGWDKLSEARQAERVVRIAFPQWLGRMADDLAELTEHEGVATKTARQRAERAERAIGSDTN